MARYIALLRKDPGSDFGVDFPDFPGCITAGGTLEEAKAMAEEALTGHIEATREVGEPVPAPSDLAKIVADPDNDDAIPFLVSVPDPESQRTRVNVALPVADLQALDRLAKRRGVSRSALIAEAARLLIAAERDPHAA